MSNQIRLLKNDNGFSLLEVLLVTAILALVSLFLAETFINYSRLYSRESVKVDLNLANQTTLNDLSSNIREAVTVLATSSLAGADFTSNSQTLILNLPSLNAQQQIISGSYDRAIYYLDPANQRKLVKKVVPDALSSRVSQAKVLNNDISFLNFYYNTSSTADAKSIITSLAVSRAIDGQSYAVTSTLRAVLRNK